MGKGQATMPRRRRNDTYGDDLYDDIFDDDYDPDAHDHQGRRQDRQVAPQPPVRLRPYHMRGRLLSFLSFPLGLATIVMMLLAFVRPDPLMASDSAKLTFVSLATGSLGMLLGLAGKIRGRKELDLPRWPSSFGMLFGFLGLVISGMVVMASIQSYVNYGEMLERAQEEEKKEDETVISYADEDGETREATLDERSQSQRAERQGE